MGKTGFHNPEYADLAERVAKVIITWRKRRGYTLEKLASLSSIGSASTLSRMESGDQIPDLQQAIRIALALEINPCLFWDGLFHPTFHEQNPPSEPCQNDDIPALPRNVIVRLILERGVLSDRNLRAYVLANIHRLEDEELAGVLIEVAHRSVDEDRPA